MLLAKLGLDSTEPELRLLAKASACRSKRRSFTATLAQIHLYKKKTSRVAEVTPIVLSSSKRIDLVPIDTSTI